MTHILKDHPAVTIFALVEGHNILLTDDKGYVRTAPLALYVKSFSGDLYEFIRSYTIGCDGDNASNVWAFGNGAMLTAESRGKTIAVGCELGDVITIEGKSYRVDAAPNKNIALVAA